MIRWELNYYNTLPLLDSEKKTLKRQGTNVVSGIYEAWETIPSELLSFLCSITNISTADRASNNYHFLWNLSSNHAQMSVRCWSSIAQLPCQLPRRISNSPTWNLQHYMQIIFFPIRYLLRSKRKILDIYLEFSSLQKWEKKVCQWLFTGKLYFLCEFKKTSSFSTGIILNYIIIFLKTLNGVM